MKVKNVSIITTKWVLRVYLIVILESDFNLKNKKLQVLKLLEILPKITIKSTYRSWNSTIKTQIYDLPFLT